MSTRGAQVVRADASPSTLAELCRCVCYPRLLLRAAELRAALVALGDEPSIGAQVRARAVWSCIVTVCSARTARLYTQKETCEIIALESPCIADVIMTGA